MMKTLFKSRTARIAALAVCSAALTAIPMVAQDTAPPPPQEGPGAHQGPPRGGPREMEARRMEMLTKQLNLTADQQTQAKAIFEASRQQMEALRNDTATAPQDKRPKMMSIRQEESAKFKALLTDEQKTKYADMEAKMRERGEERRGPGGPGGENAPPPPPPPSQQ